MTLEEIEQEYTKNAFELLDLKTNFYHQAYNGCEYEELADLVRRYENGEGWYEVFLKDLNKKGVKNISPVFLEDWILEFMYILNAMETDTKEFEKKLRENIDLYLKYRHTSLDRISKLSKRNRYLEYEKKKLKEEQCVEEENSFDSPKKLSLWGRIIKTFKGK